MGSSDGKSDLRFGFLALHNLQQGFIKSSKSLKIKKLVSDWLGQTNIHTFFECKTFSFRKGNNDLDNTFLKKEELFFLYG